MLVVSRDELTEGEEMTSTGTVELLGWKSGDEISDAPFERVDLAADGTKLITDLDKADACFLELLVRCLRLGAWIADLGPSVGFDLHAALCGEEAHGLSDRVRRGAELLCEIAVAGKLGSDDELLRDDFLADLIG